MLVHNRDTDIIETCKQSDNKHTRRKKHTNRSYTREEVHKLITHSTNRNIFSMQVRFEHRKGRRPSKNVKTKYTLKAAMKT